MKTLMVALVLAAGAPQDRLPPIPRESMTQTQRAAAEKFAAARGKEPFGPFVPLLRSPDLMLAAAAMGDHLRFHSTLPARVRELVILWTSREWGQQYEWAVHYPLAIEAGLRRELADAIGDGRRPYGCDEEEEAALSVASEILRDHRVSDVTWHRAVQQFGESGAVDLLGLAGYYSFLGAVLNGARTPAPANGAQLKRFPDP
jgi:4-carboxymuconolactone decarboxylase